MRREAAAAGVELVRLHLAPAFRGRERLRRRHRPAALARQTERLALRQLRERQRLARRRVRLGGAATPPAGEQRLPAAAWPALRRWLRPERLARRRFFRPLRASA